MKTVCGDFWYLLVGDNCQLRTFSMWWIIASVGRWARTVSRPLCALACPPITLSSYLVKHTLSVYEALGSTPKHQNRILPSDDTFFMEDIATYLSFETSQLFSSGRESEPKTNNKAKRRPPTFSGSTDACFSVKFEKDVFSLCILLTD